jgi:serine/threonine protein kinase
MTDVDQGRLLAGEYELVEPIGEGGMATVWRGLTHGAAGFSRKVAIKRVLPGLATDAKFGAMFVEEARVVAELAHPNIVQVHDFDQDEKGLFFIVMEWVEGVDLGRYVRTFTRAGEVTPWPYVAAIAIEVGKALAAAHERRDDAGNPAPVIHRDVTPSNVLLGVGGIAKLADFGLSRAADRASMTRPGTVKGKLATLLDLGTGFLPELTGWENIALNGAIMGLSDTEVARKMESIIDFADLGAFINSPVRTYSSGMYMRLGFAIAIHVDADILLIDEILAVGDAEFQHKCLARLQQMQQNGTTLLIVSHALDMLSMLCNRVIWLDRGRVMAAGQPAEVLQQYCPSVVLPRA